MTRGLNQRTGIHVAEHHHVAAVLQMIPGPQRYLMHVGASRRHNHRWADGRFGCCRSGCRNGDPQPRCSNQRERLGSTQVQQLEVALLQCLLEMLKVLATQEQLARIHNNTDRRTAWREYR